MQTARRAFSTTARTLCEFIWKGTVSKPEYEEMFRGAKAKNERLDGVTRVEFAGEEHTSTADPDPRVSGQVFKGNARLTSIHLYKDGRVVYSKDMINQSQK